MIVARGYAAFRSERRISGREERALLGGDATDIGTPKSVSILESIPGPLRITVNGAEARKMTPWQWSVRPVAPVSSMCWTAS